MGEPKFDVLVSAEIDSDVLLGTFGTKSDAEKRMYEYISGFPSEMWGDDCKIFAFKEDDHENAVRIPWEKFSPESLIGFWGVQIEADYDDVAYCFILEWSNQTRKEE